MVKSGKNSALPPKTEAEVKRILQTYRPEIVRAIGSALVERAAGAGRTGRRRIDDSARHKRVAELIVFSGMEEADAYKKAAKEDPGYTESSTLKRLRRKFPEEGAPYLEDAKLRASLQEAPDPEEAAAVLQEYVADAVGALGSSEDRETTAEVLKLRLMAVVDEVLEALDAEAVARSLNGATRPFSAEDIERAFEEGVEPWDL